MLATGFDVTASLARVPVVGRDGLILARAWGERVAAHRGLTLAGFPNFFMLLGPNTGLGHNSVVLMIEAQVGFVLACLAEMRARNLAAIEPTRRRRRATSPRSRDGCRAASGSRAAAPAGTRTHRGATSRSGPARWWPTRAMRAPDWSEFVLTPA